jgi:hypothetical protein
VRRALFGAPNQAQNPMPGKAGGFNNDEINTRAAIPTAQLRVPGRRTPLRLKTSKNNPAAICLFQAVISGPISLWVRAGTLSRRRRFAVSRGIPLLRFLGELQWPMK